MVKCTCASPACGVGSVFCTSASACWPDRGALPSAAFCACCCRSCAACCASRMGCGTADAAGAACAIAGTVPSSTDANTAMPSGCLFFPFIIDLPSLSASSASFSTSASDIHAAAHGLQTGTALLAAASVLCLRARCIAIVLLLFIIT